MGRVGSRRGKERKEEEEEERDVLAGGSRFTLDTHTHALVLPREGTADEPFQLLRQLLFSMLLLSIIIRGEARRVGSLSLPVGYLDGAQQWEVCCEMNRQTFLACRANLL